MGKVRDGKRGGGKGKGRGGGGKGKGATRYNTVNPLCLSLSE